MSWEGPHHGLDDAGRAPHLLLRSGAKTLHPWGTPKQGLRALVSKPALSLSCCS